MTPLEHDNATATVSITGLALGCYNKATQNYEVGFLRYKCHNLLIEVKKKLNGEDSVMTYQIIDHLHRIFIDAENAVSPDDPIYIVGENFDRKQPNHDREDFRWVIDFENDFNNGDPVVLRRPTVPVTEMYMEKPRLYADTALFTPEQYLLVRIDPGTNRPVENEDPQVLGFFTQGIKADITCQNGGAVILRVEGPQGFNVHLPHGYGPHEITITNICTPEAAGEEEEEEEEVGDANLNGSANSQLTDFRLFYSIIRDTNGEKYDVQSPVHGEGAVCNGSNLGGRASLFPLPLANP